MRPYGSTRVEVVPDCDAEAHQEIPKNVLEMLGPNDILMSKVGHMMYIRASHWDRIKHHFRVMQS